MRESGSLRSLVIADDVRGALVRGEPVVALESAILTHGMPYPENIRTTREAVEAIRSSGAVPAVVAVVSGLLRVGVGPDEVERLGQPGAVVRKISIRDLPVAVARGESGGTTVAATMRAASLAGIRLFATGGIGGVHVGAEDTFDISADLAELARTRVAVVCSGAKAILDLARTVELLETLGVTVVGYRTSELPAFFCRTSGLRLADRCEDPWEVAAILAARWDLGMEGGVVVANPVPEELAADPALIWQSIAGALEAARKNEIRGKDVTPFLLGRIVDATGGQSLEANRGLVVANARLAAGIARAWASGEASGWGRPAVRA